MRHVSSLFQFTTIFVVTSATFLLLALTSMYAQRGPDFLTQLKERMQLTETQADSIQKLTLEFREDLRKNREIFQADREAMRIAMRERTDTYYKDVEALMDENQKPEYEKLVEEIKERTRERFQGRDSGGGGLPRP